MCIVVVLWPPVHSIIQAEANCPELWNPLLRGNPGEHPPYDLRNTIIGTSLEREGLSIIPSLREPEQFLTAWLATPGSEEI
jgi:hypothetical protein